MADPTIPVLTLIWTMLVSLIKGYETGKKQLFEIHVEPLQEKILQIHEDYVSGFEELKQHLQGKSTPLPKVVEFLEERRRNMAALRNLTASIAQELTAAERRLVRADAWESVKAYCNAIGDYLDASVRITGFTWFSGYLDQVKNMIAVGAENPWWDSSIHGYHHPRGETPVKN